MFYVAYVSILLLIAAVIIIIKLLEIIFTYKKYMLDKNEADAVKVVIAHTYGKIESKESVEKIYLNSIYDKLCKQQDIKGEIK